MVDLPDIQMSLRPGFVEFSWGHPDRTLLPASDLQDAAVRALADGGAASLAYGAAQGPGRLLEPLSARLSVIDGQLVPPEQILVTAGITHALDLLCTSYTHPGDTILVETPVYHFALRIFRDHGLVLKPVEADEGGLRLDALEQAIADVPRTHGRRTLLYTVPTFSNPTGRSLAPDRRHALLRIAEQHALLVLEDDAYRELWFDAPPLPSLTTHDVHHVARLGSFSKIVAPGLRMGWVQTDPAFVQRAKMSGLLTSGGGINHFTAHVMAEYLRQERLDAHVAQLRRMYRTRRDTLIDALQRHLPPGCRFETPNGGFFIWMELPEGCDSGSLLAQAEAANVAYIPGTTFFSDGGGQRFLRLAFSLLEPAEMEQGAQRLGMVLRDAL
jgi:DNA-binding transcriptional MocR family regulator